MSYLTEIPEHLATRLDDPVAEKERQDTVCALILADIAANRHAHRWQDRAVHAMVAGILLLALLVGTGVIGHR